MILVDQQIIEACKNGEITIIPFEENQVQPATYDLRVGTQGATTTSKKLINIMDIGYLLLKPGDFGVLSTFETIKLSPSYTARLGLRSKYARKGLIATTGPQIDPGFEGRIILGLTNLTPKPISVPFKDDLLSIEFHKLEQPCKKPYSGPYNKKFDLRPEDIEMIVEGDSMAFSEVLTTLSSLSQNVGQLTTDVKILKWIIPLIVGIGITIIGIIVAIK